jgi:hypothetical protein
VSPCHSSTFQRIVSTSLGIRLLCWVVSVTSRTAQVEPRSGRVKAPASSTRRASPDIAATLRLASSIAVLAKDSLAPWQESH